MRETDVALFIGIISAVAALLGAALGGIVSYLVARQQFRATVLSGNRQQWINTVRDTVAEILSLALLVQRGLQSPDDDRSSLLDKGQRLAFLQSKLELLLNPAEADHQELVKTVYRYVAAIIFRAEDLAQSPFGMLASTLDPVADSKRATELSQRILKSEWERVKRGA